MNLIILQYFIQRAIEELNSIYGKSVKESKLWNSFFSNKYNANLNKLFNELYKHDDSIGAILTEINFGFTKVFCGIAAITGKYYGTESYIHDLEYICYNDLLKDGSDFMDHNVIATSALERLVSKTVVPNACGELMIRLSHEEAFIILSALIIKSYGLTGGIFDLSFAELFELYDNFHDKFMDVIRNSKVYSNIRNPLVQKQVLEYSKSLV